jgi:hypothetical protein
MADDDRQGFRLRQSFPEVVPPRPPVDSSFGPPGDSFGPAQRSERLARAHVAGMRQAALRQGAKLARAMWATDSGGE